MLQSTEDGKVSICDHDRLLWFTLVTGFCDLHFFIFCFDRIHLIGFYFAT